MNSSKQFFSRLGGVFGGQNSSKSNNNNNNNNTNNHPTRLWLNEMDIKTKSIDSSQFKYINSFSFSTSFNPSILIQDAMEKTNPLIFKFEQMRQRSFDLHNSSSFNLKSDLATYVPLDCSSGPRDIESVSLEIKIQEFLDINCPQKVFLLHGNAGSGKSLFGRWLESYLWNLFIQGDDECIIPIFVSLASLKYPSRNIIEESLTSHGFTQKQINKL
jgi:hypothetical protein